MAKTDSLFVLIKSLSSSEKRYFRLMCSSENANYTQLFDAVDGQETYNEQALKQKFSGKKFTGQLHVTKNYLRRLILKSLRDYHNGASPGAEVKECLRNAEILFNKELYGLCKAELKRAEELALDHELNSSLVEVYTWQRRLEQQLNPHNYPVFADLLKKQEEAVRKLVNTNQYWQLATGITTSFAVRGTVMPDLALLESPGNALTLEAKVLHYNSMYFATFGQNNSKKAAEALFTLVDIFEYNPEFIQREMGLYASTVNNLLSFLVFNKRYTEALQLVRKAQSRYGNWKRVGDNKGLLKQVVRTYNVELEIIRDLKTFEDNAGAIDAIEAFVKLYEGKVPREYLLSFYFQMACIRFMMKRYSKALHWANKALNNRFDNIRPDLQVQVRLLNLMVHFEQGNMFGMRHFVDSTRRFMGKIASVKPYEDLLLKFFSKAGQAFPEEYPKLFADLQQKLFPSNGEPLITPQELDYIDYKSWIGEKVGGPSNKV